MKAEARKIIEEKYPSVEHLGVYAYGSQVYGTANEESDYDFLVISETELEFGQKFEEIKKDNINIHVVTATEFQERLDKLEIIALEIYFMNEHELTYLGFHLDLDSQILRASISAKSNHSWVKAKKKITVEKDYKTGIKSLFHSIRISNYGAQIAKNGKISNYNCCQELWKELSYMSNFNWEEIDKKYRPILNNSLSTFRIYAPKTAAQGVK